MKLKDAYDGPEGQKVHQDYLKSKAEADRQWVKEYLAEKQHEREEYEATIKKSPEVAAMTLDQWQAYRKSIKQDALARIPSQQMNLFEQHGRGIVDHIQFPEGPLAAHRA